MVPAYKTKNGKVSKFVDTGGYNRNEREREGGIWQLGVGRQGGVEKKNKIVSLGTERCET